MTTTGLERHNIIGEASGDGENFGSRSRTPCLLALDYQREEKLFLIKVQATILLISPAHYERGRR